MVETAGKLISLCLSADAFIYVERKWRCGDSGLWAAAPFEGTEIPMSAKVIDYEF